MTGGIVIEENSDYDHIEIVVEDEGEQLAIKLAVTAESQCISEGDKVWWQGRKAYWTPVDSHLKCFDGVEDVEIPRIGYSYKPQTASV